ncbi:HEAT repeat domain-containing protein [Kitasatospora sp. NPDC090091]|uniref:HEAT repeat domain-containing protein n=1 Tax=Kitasatospora sp. NPDC090091 TaxID=3364081 RepID=UPI0037F89470
MNILPRLRANPAVLLPRESARPASAPAPAATEAMARLRTAVAAASSRDKRADEELIDALLAVGESGQPQDHAAALRALTEHPAVLLRLDARIRRESWYVARPAIARTDADPVTLALAASYSDGRTRERAVRRILERPTPETVPFLVLRTADWVRQVRERASAGLAVLLHEQPALVTETTVRTALLVDRRRRGTFPLGQLVAALLADPNSALAERLLAATDPGVRRFTLDATAHRLRLRELAALAETDRDRAVRTHAADAAARQAVWTNQTDLLHRLASSRHPEVRAAALTGLMRTGSPQDALPFLDDSSSAVRALARDAARRTGADPLAHYRAAVRATEPPVGAIDGLAETGTQVDGALIAGLLDHPAPQVRVHVLRALRGLGALPAARATDLLRDDSAAVVREAATALLPSARHLPADLLWDLLADPHRPALRHAGYRLLARRDRPTALRAALLLVGDPDPRLAARGRADAIGRIRALTPEPWHTRPVPSLGADPTQSADLLALARQHRAELTDEVVGLLADALDRPPATG